MGNRKAKQVLSGGWYQWEWGGHKERVQDEYGGNIMYSWIQMEKIRPVETILGVRVGGYRKMMGRGNSTMIYFENFCNCHNVPPVQE
jgi:hypothetical protein